MSAIEVRRRCRSTRTRTNSAVPERLNPDTSRIRSGLPPLYTPSVLVAHRTSLHAQPSTSQRYNASRLISLLVLTFWVSHRQVEQL
jgi:hypothetical protein